jgi:hypothetical protein
LDYEGNLSTTQGARGVPFQEGGELPPVGHGEQTGRLEPVLLQNPGNLSAVPILLDQFPVGGFSSSRRWETREVEDGAIPTGQWKVRE